MIGDSQTTAQRAEVEANFLVFQRERPALLDTDRGRYAVYRGGSRIATMDTFRDALELIGVTGGFPASVQEITDRAEWCYATA